MASSRQDFDRFVRWIYQSEQVSSDVRRLGSLCLANFDALAGTSRNRNQRSVYLTGLMRQQLVQTMEAAPAFEANVAEGEWPWSSLHSLTLGPFRGFRTPELFELDKQITLLYGPNGSGKTSLCEALEYALLGDVEEAGNKRIAARTYLANLHAGRLPRQFSKPSITENKSLMSFLILIDIAFALLKKTELIHFHELLLAPMLNVQS